MSLARLFTLSLTLLTCSPAGRAVVNEVLYDATGDDTGWEFVELWNPGAAPVQLAGVKLEAGDGSAAGRWTVRWTGAAADTVRPHARFVIGGARVSPPPDAVATLELQNGPDAVRLTWPDGVTEVLGWGVHEFAEYACGAPAPDVASGQSLARVPDGADGGGNAVDFRAADPSPGRANQSNRDVAVRRGSLATSPERPGANAPARLTATVENRGREALLAGEVMLRLSCVAWTTPVAWSAPALAPGDTVRAELEVQLPAGTWTIQAAATLAGDETPGNDADTLRVAAGPPPLVITEIQFHPADGGGEWVEVLNASGLDVALAGWTLTDRGGTRGRTSAAFALSPDSLALLAQDRAALIARHPGLDSTRVFALAPWPSLNNSDDSTGVADAIETREPGGFLAERVAYSAAGVPTGVPIERDQGLWRPAAGTEGTPLRPPATPRAVAGGFALSPRRVPAGGAVRVAWDLPWPRARVSVALYDLAGRRVGVPAPEATAPARGERAVSLGDLSPGVYVAVLTARGDDGRAWTGTRALRVEGRER